MLIQVFMIIMDPTDHDTFLTNKSCVKKKKEREKKKQQQQQKRRVDKNKF